IAAKIDELRSALSGEAPAPRPTGPLRSGTGPLAGAAWAGSRPQEALLSVLAGRRARDGEYAGAPSAPGADGVPGLIGAVLAATGTKERLDHFAELVTDIRSDPEAGDVESEGRAADEAAARAAVLALARISVSGQHGGMAPAAAGAGSGNGRALPGVDAGTPLEELLELADDARLRAAIALARSRAWIEQARLLPALGGRDGAIQHPPNY